MSRRTWTEHRLTDGMLRQLCVAMSNDRGSVHPGVGKNAGSSRSALKRRGLIRETTTDYTSPTGRSWPIYDDVITPTGREALAAARAEGW